MKKCSHKKQTQCFSPVSSVGRNSFRKRVFAQSESSCTRCDGEGDGTGALRILPGFLLNPFFPGVDGTANIEAVTCSSPSCRYRISEHIFIAFGGGNAALSLSLSLSTRHRDDAWTRKWDERGWSNIDFVQP